jgi:DNA mismatch repair ATPase MutS
VTRASKCWMAFSQWMGWAAGLPDVERLTRKLERRKATLADLCQLYRASSRLPMMEEAFREHGGPHAQLLVSRYGPLCPQISRCMHPCLSLPAPACTHGPLVIEGLMRCFHRD